MELDRQIFLNFGMLLETHMKLGVTGPDLFRKNFARKTGKMVQK